MDRCACGASDLVTLLVKRKEREREKRGGYQDVEPDGLERGRGDGRGHELNPKAIAGQFLEDGAGSRQNEVEEEVANGGDHEEGEDNIDEHLESEIGLNR